MRLRRRDILECVPREGRTQEHRLAGLLFYRAYVLVFNHHGASVHGLLAAPVDHGHAFVAPVDQFLVDHHRASVLMATVNIDNGASLYWLDQTPALDDHRVDRVYPAPCVHFHGTSDELLAPRDNWLILVAPFNHKFAERCGRGSEEGGLTIVCMDGSKGTFYVACI